MLQSGMKSGFPRPFPFVHRPLNAAQAALPTSSGFAGDAPPRRIEDRIFRRCRLNVLEFPRVRLLRYRRRSVSGSPQKLHPPAPDDELPKLPWFIHPPALPERIYGLPRIFFGLWLLRHLTRSRSPSRCNPSEVPMNGDFGSPPNPCSSALPFPLPRVAPISLPRLGR